MARRAEDALAGAHAHPACCRSLIAATLLQAPQNLRLWLVYGGDCYVAAAERCAGIDVGRFTVPAMAYRRLSAQAAAAPWLSARPCRCATSLFLPCPQTLRHLHSKALCTVGMVAIRVVMREEGGSGTEAYVSMAAARVFCSDRRSQRRACARETSTL